MVSPATTPTVSGRNNGTDTVRAVNATNSPFSLIAWRNGGPLDAFGWSRTATPMRTGTRARAASTAQVRRRRNSRPISEPSSANGRTVGGAVSTCDIEPLPGECDEALLERLALHGETAHPDPGVHQSRRHGLGSDPGRQGRDDGLRRPVRGETHARQHLTCGRGVGRQYAH